MSRTTRHDPHPRTAASRTRSVPVIRRSQRAVPGRFMRGIDSGWQRPFVPPENWHEPTGEWSTEYRFVEQPAGPGLRHPVTSEEIRDRLAELPAEMLWPLDVVQLSRLTRKKRLFPLYGMQWGTAIYLYPIAENLVEEYPTAPVPRQRVEAAMFGGRWQQTRGGIWRLTWTEASIRDFYLNNVLIHELGHLLDNRNTRQQDRERYAEWFAVQYGYKPSRSRFVERRPVVRRHHAK